MKTKLPVYLLGLFLLLISLLGGRAADPLADPASTITPTELRSLLHFVASDEMQGRDTDTPENRLAAHFLALELAAYGMKPAGEDGTFYQHVELVQGMLLPNQNSLRIQNSGPLAKTGVLLEDYYPSALSGNGAVSAPVVFAGYGITAPEYDYDDYQGIGTEGKIVAVLQGEPQPADPMSVFEGLVSSEYSREFHKILNAQERGAVGVLFLTSPYSRSRPGQSVWSEDIEQARYVLAAWTEKIQIPAVYLNEHLTEALLRGQEFDLSEVQRQLDENLSFRAGRPLNSVTASLQTAISRRELSVPNVLALWPGSDPLLSEEIVIVSAHFDHVGVRDGEIFNGADDDGSGTVAVLEIAEAFAAAKDKPKRSILFALWNAEEQGLLGSRYFARHPVRPLEKVAGVFQMDMVGRNQEIPTNSGRRFHGLESETAEENENTLHVLGYSRNSGLVETLTQANQEVGLDLRFELDNHGLNLIRRSDNWPFLIRGVPTLFFTSGLHPDYHRPEDTADRINYEKLARVARLVFKLAHETASRTERFPPSVPARRNGL